MKKFALTSLTVLMACHAYAEQLVTVPTLEGGLTASIGTFYAAPGAGDYNYANHVTENVSDSSFGSITEPAYNSTEYDFGFEASLGYVFEDTANGLELSYRGLHSTSDASIGVDDPNNQDEYIDVPGGGPWPYKYASNELTYNFDTVDLMLSQFVNLGEFVQMRLSGGLAYAYIKQNSQSVFTDETAAPVQVGLQETQSKFQGFGPRVASDARYDFGDGFGIVGGGSVAYFMGELKSANQFFDETTTNNSWDYEENIDNHSVLNVRANLGIDYVYFFEDEEGSTVGLELGYLADYYVEALNEITAGSLAANYGPSSVLQSASFAGPYVNVKGVF